MNKPQKKQIFREESLERLSSPERLDLLTQIVNRRDWLPLSTLGTLVIATIVWSIFGKIPIDVTGKGLLVVPHRVVNLQSPVEGQLQQLNIKPGDCIAKDDVIATIDPFEIRQELELARKKLVQLQNQEHQANTLQNQRTDLEIKAIEQEQTAKRQRFQDALRLSPILKERELGAIEQEKIAIQKQINEVRVLTPQLREREIRAIAEQQMSLEQQLQDAQAQAPVLKKRSEKRRALVEQGAISEDLVLEGEQEYRQSLQDISKLKAELQQLETQKTEVQQKYLDNQDLISKYQARLSELDIDETGTQQKYLENLSTISQLKAELQQLDTQIKILEQQNQEASAGRKNPIQEVQHNIVQLEKKLEFNQEIKSPYSGCILELTADNSSVINPGDRLGSIKVDNSIVAEPISGIAYFSVGDGKKIQPGMKIFITPDTVRRERYGGIVGTVTEVSAFPVTKLGASNLVGNTEVVETMISELGSVIAIQAELEPDPLTSNGYKWSSSNGPKSLNITSGTTTITRVRVNSQAPISFVIPLLREWSGIVS